MIPQLVNIEEMKNIKEIKILTQSPQNINKSKNNFDYQSLFNMIGILIILIGIFTLYKRKTEKEINQKDLELKIYRLNQKINN
tara:strand:- start:288 stop:536 length:249 start_codon:yes stop_codon:yes gene_type:complete